MAENFNEPEIRGFVGYSAGEDVVARRGPQLNPHWYEHGAMKAARNARFRLIPGNVRAQVIATARQRDKPGRPSAGRDHPQCARIPLPASAAARSGPLPLPVEQATD